MYRSRVNILGFLALLAGTLVSLSFPGLVLAQYPRTEVVRSMPTASDTLHLDELRAAAARQDPRAVQPELLHHATRLRVAALHAQRRPQLSLNGQATVQNEVPEIPLERPGQKLPSSSRDQFRAQIETEWTLYDGGRVNQQAAAERAELRENIAGVATTLYALREAATEAFFSALLSEARARTLTLTADNLKARLQIVRKQTKEGTALPAASAALEADLIRVRQQIEEANTSRRAALRVLAELTDAPIGPSDSLALPNLDEEVSRTLRQLEMDPSESASRFKDATLRSLLGRPEVVRISRTVERLEAEARMRETQTRPSLSLFGQAGIGRPSPFNFLSDDLSGYGLAGFRLRWSVFDWNRADREAEALRMQARIAQTKVAAFVRQVDREIEDKLADLKRLRAAIEEDERQIEFRSEALRATRHQLEEGVILVDTYTDRLSNLAEARLTLERHRIEHAQAQVNLLSALGRYPEPRSLATETVKNNPNFE